MGYHSADFRPEGFSRVSNINIVNYITCWSPTHITRVCWVPCKIHILYTYTRLPRYPRKHRGQNLATQILCHVTNSEPMFWKPPPQCCPARVSNKLCSPGQHALSPRIGWHDTGALKPTTIHQILDYVMRLHYILCNYAGDRNAGSDNGNIGSGESGKAETGAREQTDRYKR